MRCAYCHSDAAGQGEGCPHCRTWLHDDCWSLSGECPTLGCQRGARSGSPSKAPRRYWLGLVLLGLCAVSLMGAMAAVRARVHACHEQALLDPWLPYPHEAFAAEVTSGQSLEAVFESGWSEPLVGEADAALDSGKHDQAQALYDVALSTNPENAYALCNRGGSKRRAGDLKGAIADYDAALRLRPDYTLVWHKRGYARAKLGDHAGAIEDFSKALALGRRFSSWSWSASMSYRNRAHARRELGDLVGALEDYRASLGDWAAAEQAYGAVGGAKARSGVAEGDGRYYGYELADRMRAETLFGLAFTATALGRWGEARKAWQELQQVDPHRPFPPLWLACLAGRPPSGEQPEGWPGALWRYLAGELDASSLLAEAIAAPVDERPGRLCSAHAFLGLQAELRGAVALSQAHYRSALDTEASDWFQYELAQHRTRG